jgi:hypothetical protein
MTKKKTDSSQQTIFDWIKKAEELTRQSANPAPGSMDIDKELKAALTEDLRHAQESSGKDLSRAEVAARMTDLSGAEITSSMLYNWTALSHPHSIPAKFMPVFIIATGGRRAFEVLSRRAGLFALPGPEALRAEIQRLHEEEQRINKERKKREMFLEEIEKGRQP